MHMRRVVIHSALALVLAWSLVGCAQGEDTGTQRRDTQTNEGAEQQGRQRDAGGDRFQVQLQPLNGSEASGTAEITVDGTSVTVRVEASGLEPDQRHPMHLHGFRDGQPSRLPAGGGQGEGSSSVLTDTPGADGGVRGTPGGGTDENTAGEQGATGAEDATRGAQGGAGGQGPQGGATQDDMLTSMDTEQSIGPALLPLEPFPVADEDGRIMYERTFEDVDMYFPLDIRGIEIHGMTVGDTFDFTLPVAAGLLGVQGAQEGTEADEQGPGRGPGLGNPESPTGTLPGTEDGGVGGGTGDGTGGTGGTGGGAP